MKKYEKKMKIYLPFFAFSLSSYNKGIFNNKVFQLFINPKNKEKIKIFRLESIS
jgi:hypothetical protein